MIKFIETEEKIGLTDLLSFEVQYNYILPKAYKSHIMQYNGGYPEDEIFFDDYPIDNFFSIKYGEDTVEENIKILSDVIEGKFFPFGDSLGGILYISFNKNSLGKVYVMYSDGQTDFLADSFEEFMNGLSKEQDL